jgi:hypothetical protein
MQVEEGDVCERLVCLVCMYVCCNAFFKSVCLLKCYVYLWERCLSAGTLPVCGNAMSVGTLPVCGNAMSVGTLPVCGNAMSVGTLPVCGNAMSVGTLSVCGNAACLWERCLSVGTLF